MTASFTAADALAWTGGELLRGGPAAAFPGVSIDTRTLPRGVLFVAIAGPHHDAHAFLGAALERGAGGLLIERGRPLPAGVDAELPVIAVDDTTRALGALAAGHRARFDGPVVAITGSNGKTTTKEMCAAILSARAPCLKNEGNLNNEYGLPLTLLRRRPEHRSAVVELGMNHRGEIARLAAIARPDVGVITNVGSAHIEHLGSREEIALEKGDLVAALPADATAVLNADDPRVAAMAARTAARVVRFGRDPGADVRAEGVRCADAGRGYAFSLRAPAGRVDVGVAGLGEATLSNALAAAAGALAAGASLDDVAAGLAAHRPAPGRLQPIGLADRVELIDDTYNANPQSLEHALRVLARRRGEGRALAVLGDMGELGETGPVAHREAGRLVATLGLDGLVAVGRLAAEIAAGARDAGMEAGRVAACDDAAEAAAHVRRWLRPGDRVLVKGSRSMRMERVVEALRAGAGG